MNLDDITPLILTLNEEANIARTLAALTWARDIVVVDSGSSDQTLEILKRDRRVRVFGRPFDSHSEQWTYALNKTGVGTTWVLALDADYVLSEALITELRELAPPGHVDGFRASFNYLIAGRPLRSSLYPPSVVLFRRERAAYAQDGHTQRLRMVGAIQELHGRINHDDRKAFSRWRAAQRRYLELEARKLNGLGFAELAWPDRIRRLYLGPFLVVPYCLFVKGLLFDGWRGLQYTFQRLYAETVLAFLLFRK